MTLWCERRLQDGRNSGRAVARMSSGACAPLLGESLHQIERGRIGPVQVLEDEHGRLRARPGEKPRDQRRQLPAAQFLGRKLRRALLRQRDVHQRRDQGRIFGGVEADAAEACSRGRRGAARQAHPRRSAGVPIRRAGAAAYSAGAATTTIRQRCAASRGASARNSSMRRDLPMPGSPTTSASWPAPLAAPLPAPAQELELLLAPDEGGEGARAARLPPLARTIRKSVVGSGAPFRRCAPRSSATNRPDT